MLKIYVRGETPDAELVRREANARDVSGAVAEIIADVRENGDAALLKYNARFDNAGGVALEVTPEELDAALGFNVYVLDADSGYTAEEFTVIDGTVGEIIYRNEAGAELCLRTAKGAEDISGVQGATLTDQSTEQVKIQSGSLDDLLVAWLTNDTMACSLTAKGLDQAAFDALIQQLTPQLAPEM